MRVISNQGLTIVLASTLVLTGCQTGFEMAGFNLKGDTFGEKIVPRPEPDGRGVITYPNYQVVVARQGDTLTDVANRIDLGASELARHNGLPADQRLREGELLALPRKVASSGGVDIEAIALSAIDNAGSQSGSSTAGTSSGIEPIRHQVERGETAYSIARLYDVSVNSLALWNGLDTDLSVREGQHLIIPIVEAPTKRTADASKPGAGSVTPLPPSASTALPSDVKTEPLPASPDLGQFKTASSDRKFLMPVQGKVIRDFSGKKGGNDGIDISATAGTAVKAAEDGKVALISKSVGANTIILLRHADNIYTVYSNVANVSLKKGVKVKRGQRIAVVAKGSPSFLHFEVRSGTQSVDPTPFLQ